MNEITKNLIITNRDNGKKRKITISSFTPIPNTSNIKIFITNGFTFRSIVMILISIGVNFTVYSNKKEIMIYNVSFNIVENGN